MLNGVKDFYHKSLTLHAEMLLILLKKHTFTISSLEGDSAAYITDVLSDPIIQIAETLADILPSLPISENNHFYDILLYTSY